MSRKRKQNSRRPVPDRSQQRADEALMAAVLEVKRASHRPTPAQTAQADQMEAGARDLIRRMHAMRPDMGLIQGRDVAQVLAVIHLAWQRRGGVLCPHYYEHLDSGAPVLVSLTDRRAYCVSCAARAFQDEVDDGRCDVCDLPAPDGQFREVISTVSNLTVHANVGDCCYDALAAAAGSGAA